MIRFVAPLALALAGCGLLPTSAPEPDPARQMETWKARTEAGVAAARAGRTAEAEKEFLAALEAITTIAGHERPVVATLHHLAQVYAHQGRGEAAEGVLRKGIAFAEERLGPTHEDALLLRRTLAGLHLARRNLGDAEGELRKIAETAGSAEALEDLAGFLAAQGRFAEAEPLLGRARALWQETLGAENPDFAVRLDRQARLYAGAGEFAAAADLLERAAALSERTLGPDHPNVAASLKNLAAVRKQVKP